MSTEPKQVAPKLIEVKLLKEHTHAEVKHPAGTTIKVSEPEKAWLEQQKIIAADSASKETK